MGNSDRDLDHLDGILAALPKEDLPMTLSELDGYMTGILCCPDPIAASDWLPHVWGETGDGNFPDIASAELAVSAVTEHYHSIKLRLTQTPWIEPIYEVDPRSGETLWEPWIDGFTRAMRLRPEAWQTLLEQADEETQSSLIFLLALQDINEGASRFTDDEIDEIDIEAPDLIPSCVAAILLLVRPTLALTADNLSGAPIEGNRAGRDRH